MKRIAITIFSGSLLLSGVLLFFFLSEKEEEIKTTKTTKGEEENQVKFETEEDIRSALGQSFIVGIPGVEIDERTEEILHYIKPAGIILYRRNYEDDSQFKELILGLQEISIKTTGKPYLIMLDEEPEGASRIDLLKNIFSLGVPKWEKIEDDIEILSDLGINVLLAPLADFPFNENAFVERRIPTKNEEELIAFNKTFIELLSDHEIAATLKHFPGLGVFSEDSHKEKIRMNVKEEIFGESLYIFSEGINHGADFVMTSHAAYDNVDLDNAATFSSKIIKDTLINRLGFDGIVVTDDLTEMPLIMDEVNITKAGIRAIEAGHHLVMFSHRPEETKKTFNEMVNEVKDSDKLQQIIKDNYLKIRNYKEDNLS